MKTFDLYGWYNTDPKYANRQALYEPTPAPGLPVVGQPYPNWTGFSWVYLNYVEPPVELEPELTEDPRIWWLDVGPFKDRLGMDTLAIAASSHPVCLAVKEMLYDRKYIDLRDPKVTQLLDILIATSQPDTSPYFPGSGPMTAQKKDIIINAPTTESERHIKGMQ